MLPGIQNKPQRLHQPKLERTSKGIHNELWLSELTGLYIHRKLPYMAWGGSEMMIVDPKYVCLYANNG